SIKQGHLEEALRLVRQDRRVDPSASNNSALYLALNVRDPSAARWREKFLPALVAHPRFALTWHLFALLEGIPPQRGPPPYALAAQFHPRVEHALLRRLARRMFRAGHDASAMTAAIEETLSAPGLQPLSVLDTLAGGQDAFPGAALFTQ